MKFIIFFIQLFALTTLANASEIKLLNAKIRLVPPVAPATAMFLKIENTSNKNIELLSVTSADFKDVEIHEMKMENNAMVMRPMKSLAIPAKSTVELKAGGYHIMIMNLQKTLKANDHHTFTFEFSDKEKITTKATVESMN